MADLGPEIPNYALNNNSYQKSPVKIICSLQVAVIPAHRRESSVFRDNRKPVHLWFPAFFVDKSGLSGQAG